MKNVDMLTSGQYIKEARESKDISISDLAFQMAKDKENKTEIRKLENKITKWEANKDYPILEEIYDMAYIIPINPGELIAIRNRGRKQFIKSSNEPKTRKHDWMSISDDAYIIFITFIKMASLILGIVFIFWLARFVDTFFGKTGSIVEEELLTRKIEEHTVENYEPINDGTVENMVKRKLREENEKN